MLTGESTGQVLSGERLFMNEVSMRLSEAEDHLGAGARGEPVSNLAPSQTLSTWRRSLTGTWEISRMPAATPRVGG